MERRFKPSNERFAQWKGLVMHEHGLLRSCLDVLWDWLHAIARMLSRDEREAPPVVEFDWVARIDSVERDFSRRAVAYYLGTGAEKRDFSYDERQSLAREHGQEFGRPTLLIADVAQGVPEEGFSEGVRAWMVRSGTPYEAHRTAIDALNRALLSSAEAKAEALLDAFRSARH